MTKPAFPDDLPLPARILRAAFITFGEQGFDKTSMDQVAEVAGTTKRTVYAHFTNKETLFRASFGQAADWFDRELPPLDPEGAAEAQLIRFASRFSDLSTWIGPVRLQRVAMAEAERMADIAQALHRDVIDRAEARLAAFLTAKGHAEAATLAAIFLNMTTGRRRFATLLAAEAPAAQHPHVSGFGRDEAFVTRAVRLFLAGLAESQD